MSTQCDDILQPEDGYSNQSSSCAQDDRQHSPQEIKLRFSKNNHSLVSSSEDAGAAGNDNEDDGLKTPPSRFNSSFTKKLRQ